ncbi:MAG: stage V sporulation protein AD, partial [Clostridiales bacterium]|nr:stage V sporulation protein AD [Clostridiales bacterium]
MAKKIGSQTILLDRKVYIRERACIVGEKEKNGPLGEFFDQYEEAYFGEDTWEKAESKFLSSTYDKLLTKLNLNDDAVDCILGGDLINQCMSSAFGLKKTYRPYLGLFGACSTMAESILVGSLFIDGGGFDNVACITSSHFCAAEKQFRAPLELGVQRAPTSQWTVTGSGAVLLSWEEGTAAKVTEGTSEIVYGKKSKPFITAVTPGKILDYNVTDANNMGAAMAPAAASTIMAHLSDTGRSPDYYDLIITGDLGIIGGELCKDIMENHGYLM